MLSRGFSTVAELFATTIDTHINDINMKLFRIICQASTIQHSVNKLRGVYLTRRDG